MEIVHNEMVTRLAKDGGQILSELSSERCHLWHMATGISGEVAELIVACFNEDLDNMLEEFGDTEFYMEGMYQGLSAITPFILVHQALSYNDAMAIEADPLLAIILDAGNVLDMTKKIVAYNDDSKLTDLVAAVLKLRSSLDRLYAVVKIEYADALSDNIEKLRKRYEGFVFTDKAAKERADKPEGE